jgi:hypothetical protein
MKQFTVIRLFISLFVFPLRQTSGIMFAFLLSFPLNAWACAIPGTHNYYLFSTVGARDWSVDTENRTLENWRAYTGMKELYWFDEDTLRAVAKQKNDALMVSYIDCLSRYLDVARMAQNTWDYPTKQDLQDRRKSLLSLQRYALSKTKTRLRSQHALLYMRCNMMLGQHQTNIAFWEQTASKYINSVYRDMMRNIYAGALLKKGRADEATQIFMEHGDMQSLYTYYYKRRSFEAIRSEYRRNPDSPAMPFLLQDFANNAQEAYDAMNDEMNLPGKLFIRDISQTESRNMCAFVNEVLREQKTHDPALWKSLQAWLQYLLGERGQAREGIAQAVAMEGRPRSKDNARLLRLYIESSQRKADGTLDDFLAEELQWLETKMLEEQTAQTGDFFGNHYTRAYDRLVTQQLLPRYSAAGRADVATAFLAVLDEMSKSGIGPAQQAAAGASRIDEYGWNGDYADEFFHHIDTMPIPQFESYMAYIHAAPATPLARWLTARVRRDEQFFNELLGTKYLRLGRWQEAAACLSKVGLDFVNNMNIAPFMARRDYKVEPWFNRQLIKEEQQTDRTLRTSRHQKLEFAREMLQLEQGMGTLSATEKVQRAYDLAVRYTQASYAGRCWYITRYGQSVRDTLRPDETDMLRKAGELLAVAQTHGDLLWQERVLYAQAWLPLEPWYENVWDDETLEILTVLHPEHRQYKALVALSQFERKKSSPASQYVSRCDVLKKFVKAAEGK